MTIMNNNSIIYVAGHRGMVGSAIVRALKGAGHTRILTRTSSELDLTCQQGVRDFFESQRPEFVFLAAAKVGVSLPTAPCRRISSTATS